LLSTIRNIKVLLATILCLTIVPQVYPGGSWYGGGGSTLIELLDEAISQGKITKFNFAGAGVTATKSGKTATITIPGGGGGGFSVYLEEGDVAKLNNSAADMTLDFDATDFETAVVGAELNLTIPDDGHLHTGASLSNIDISLDTNLTAGDALTLTDDDIDFDGGAAPAGELGGTWALPTIDTTHSGSAHHSAATVTDTTTVNLTLVGQDIQADGLYTAGDNLTLTGADIDLDASISLTSVTATSFVIGANTLTTTEWANLDGQDQSVLTTSVPQFSAINLVRADPYYRLTPTAGDAFEIYAFGSELYCTNYTTGNILWKSKSNGDFLPIAEKKSISFVIASPSASSDYPLWRPPYAITISAIHVQCTGGTNVIGGLDEYNTAGATIVAAVDSDITATAAANTNDDGSLTNPTIAASNYLFWHTTSISGLPTSVTVTFDYKVDNQ